MFIKIKHTAKIAGVVYGEKFGDILSWSFFFRVDSTPSVEANEGLEFTHNPRVKT